MKSWVEFWNADNPIYVSERHKTLHYRAIARDIAALIPDGDPVVMDYGCGEALSADLVAARARRLILVDAAETVREKLAARFAGNRAIQVLAPEEAEYAATNTLDLAVVHSVAQYLTRDQLARLIVSLAGQLKPGGILVLGDILPKGLSPLTDARALLEFGWQGGFFIPAVTGLVRTALSDYRRIRGELGLAHYAPEEMLDMLETAGLTARRLEKNLGHNQARMAFAAAKFKSE
jgi:SAM-dependent methyltransferase